MPSFDNLAHRKKLEALGVLLEDETSVSAHVLAQRILDSRKIASVLYILQQEVAHDLQQYFLIDSMVNLARKTALGVNHQDELPEAITALKRVISVVQRASERTVEMKGFMEMFEHLLLAHPELIVTKEIREHMRTIQKLIADVFEQTRNKREFVLGSVREVDGIVVNP